MPTDQTSVYIHVDNGGYTFRHDQYKHKTNPNGMGVTFIMGFYGYGDTIVTMPQLTAKDCRKLAEFFELTASEMENYVEEET